ncbi:MAG TPA: dihydroorotate dehydrogenase [Candidatus Margulisiibacteriota bacterium]|nr:dihydroorotate dehydrogenase [Candidatus Margulisiibacteriota bacterium]
MQPKLSVKIGKLKLKNPVMVASGTFGYAEEFRDFLNLRNLGAVVSKTVTLKMRQGNPPPRTCETPAGMLNSIGLENPGLDKFLSEKLPFLKKLKVPIVMSIASENDPQEFVELASRLDKVSGISALELNISCPNIRSHAARLIAQSPEATYEVVNSVRRATNKTIITKLSPNVEDIASIALSAEEAGSDAVSLINTLTGMSIDINTRRPKIASVVAGLSGPAIRPVAVRMVREVYQKIKIPIVGMGGIMDASSAIEFFIAGACAVSIGTANFVNPKASTEVIRGIKEYLARNKIQDIQELIGSLEA